MTSAEKVKERFDWNQIRTAKPLNYMMLNVGYNDFPELVNDWLRPLRKLNVSLVFTDEFSLGDYTNGSYDNGLIGMLARNEVDTLPLPASYGGLIGESVIRWPPLVAIDLHMLSGRGESIEQAADVSDNLRQLSRIVYAYYVICTIVVIIVLSVNKKTKYRKLFTVFKQLYRNIGHTYSTLLDQEHLIPRSNHIILLWTINCVAIYVFVFGFLMNLMQTSMVNIQWPPTIDRFSDLVGNTELENISTVMFKKWFDYVRTTSPGTEQRIIYNRMAERGDCSDNYYANCSFINFEMMDPIRSMSMATSVAKGIESASMVFIGADIIVKAGLRNAMCYFRPLAVEKYHYSSSLTSDFLTWLWSPSVDPYILKYGSTMITMGLVESGIFKRIIDTVGKTAIESKISPDMLDPTACRCLFFPPMEDDIDEQLKDILLTKRSLTLSAILIGAILAFALIILLMELLVFEICCRVNKVTPTTEAQVAKLSVLSGHKDMVIMATKNRQTSQQKRRPRVSIFKSI